MRRGQTRRSAPTRKDREMASVKEKIKGIIINNTNSLLLSSELEKMADGILEMIKEEVEERMGPPTPRLRCDEKAEEVRQTTEAGRYGEF